MKSVDCIEHFLNDRYFLFGTMGTLLSIVLFIDVHLGNGYFLMMKVLFIPTNVFFLNICSLSFYIFFGELPHVKNVRKKNERLKNSMNHCKATLSCNSMSNRSLNTIFSYPFPIL